MNFEFLRILSIKENHVYKHLKTIFSSGGQSESANDQANSTKGGKGP